MAELIEIIEGLRSHPAELLTPAYAEISLIGACNFGCVQCHQHHHIKEDRARGGAGARRLDFARVMELLDELAALGVPTIELCGRGEPTLFPGLDRVIARAKELGLRGTLVTNGSRLNSDLGDAIDRSRWDEVSVSIYGGTEAAFDAVTRARGGVQLSSILTNIAELRRRAPRTRITVSWLLQAEALAGLEGMLGLLETMDVDEHQFLPIVPYVDGTIVQGAAHAEADARFGALLERALADVAERRDLPAPFQKWAQAHLADPTTDTILTTYARVPCRAGRWALFVCDDGTVRPCSNSNWVLGYLGSQRLSEIWTAPEYERFRACSEQHVIRTRTSIPHSACTHCGWARMQRSLHDAVVADDPPGGAWLENPY